MSKHTPGPWTAKNNGQHWNNVEIDNWIITYGNDDEQIVDHVYAEEDARLIAAAPELLAACRWALTNAIASRNHDSDTPYVASLRAAIAKATGE